MRHVSGRAYTQQELDKLNVSRLNHICHRILRDLKGRDLSKIGFKELALAYAILQDKSLLLQGRSTSNVAIALRADVLTRIQTLGDRLESVLDTSKPRKALPRPSDKVLDVHHNGSYGAQVDSGESIPAGDTLELTAQPEPVAPARRGRGRKLELGKSRLAGGKTTPLRLAPTRPTSGGGESLV